MSDPNRSFFLHSDANKANIPVILLAGVLAILATIGILKLIFDLGRGHCPASTFLAGRSNIAAAVQMLTVFAASISPAMMIAKWLAHIPKRTREYLARNAREYGEPDYATSQRLLWKMTLYGALIAIPIVVMAAYPRYCLTPDEVIYEPSPLQQSYHFTWNDLEGIKTSCRKGFHGRWSRDYALVFNGNIGFSIFGWTYGFRKAYPALTRALQGHKFWFNDQAVEPSCDLRGFAFLKQSSGGT